MDPIYCGVPLAMEPGSASRFLAAGNAPGGRGAQASPITATVGPVALIALHGVLMQRTQRDPDGKILKIGYDSIRGALLSSVADASIRAIALDIDSPGGEVAGLADLADMMFQLRSVKPIVAICSENALSAAYWLASAATIIAVPRTGSVGSVGIITAITDTSRALDKQGIAVRFVVSGSRKAEELRAAVTGVSDEVLERVQRDVDAVAGTFIAAVARNRGISPDAVRAQEAECFMGASGVAAGLADVVAAPDEVLAALLADLDAA